jgi:NADH-quinone oxidoreductase subunit N
MYIIGSAVNADYIILAIIMALNSAIAAYYYLKLVVYMFLKDPIANDKVEFLGNANNTLKTVIGISALVTISAIFFINPLLEIISYYVQVSGF